jgi:murein DD-endopeptidase MepM/ murein hydrolase activator NlpD
MKKGLIIAAGVTLLYFMTTQKAFAKITALQKFRGCDPKGCGHFGASRTHGKHRGVDIVAKVGENIFSPITGKVTRYPIPYADDARYSGIEITNSTYTVKMFYLQPVAKIGNQVIAGQAIGMAQNLALKFGSTMTNHVHIEVYDKTGKLIDPSNLL